MTSPEDLREAYQRLLLETTGIESYIPFAQHCLRGITGASGASDAEIETAEQQLKISFPRALKALWRESNGIFWDSTPLIMPVEALVIENEQFRAGDLCEFYMSFDSILAFGESGTGDLFFYPIQWDGRIRNDIFLHDHEDDSRTYFAGTLKDFFLALGSGRY